MRIPYYKQETAWSCGAASMRMALAALGIKRSEAQLRRILKTSKRLGTPNRELPAVAERLRLSYQVMRRANIYDLKNMLHQGFVIIVSFINPKDKEGHFAVVRSIDNNRIDLLDPIEGPDTSYKHVLFKQNWKSAFGKDRLDHGWCIALKRK